MTLTKFKKNTEYNIKYINNSGQRSERKIRVISAYTSSYGTGYIRAWCYKRGEERTFRIDRVVEAAAAGRLDSVRLTENNSINADKVLYAAGSGISRTGTAGINSTLPPVKDLQEVKADGFHVRVDSAAVPISPGENKTYTEDTAVYNTQIQSGSRKKDSGSNLLGRIISYTLTFIFIGKIGIGPAADLFYPQPPVYTDSISYSDIKRLIPTPPAPVLPPQPPPAPAAVHKAAVIKPPPAPVPAVSAISERNAAFRAASGISSATLETVYEAADINRDGALDWTELEKFQKALYRQYDYIYNDTALKPDEFMAAGGGDCEDWALFTCGLLEYWGIASFAASFGPEQGTGHAVAMVFLSEKPPAEYSAYRIENYAGFPDGWYVPVDYDQVGSLTSAVKRGWKLRNLFRPRDIYGVYM